MRVTVNIHLEVSEEEPETTVHRNIGEVRTVRIGPDATLYFRSVEHLQDWALELIRQAAETRGPADSE